MGECCVGVAGRCVDTLSGHRTGFQDDILVGQNMNSLLGVVLTFCFVSVLCMFIV